MELSIQHQVTNEAIKRAEDHANAVHPEWSDKALELFKVYLRQQKQPFMIEDFRAWVDDKIPTPPTLRAYGPLAARALKLGLIKHEKYGKVKNVKAHRANCSVWVAK